MKALVVYDSVYGNTEKVARAIGAAISPDTSVVRAEEARPVDVKGIDLLIVGSPTQGFRPVKAVQTFIDNLPGDALKGITTAVFDTRMPAGDAGMGLRLIMKMGGYAAPRMAKALERKGGQPAAPPEGFLVQKQEGPLLEGELERASAWGKGLIRPSSSGPIPEHA